MKVGECVDFLVINHLEVDTGVHFHGIQQTGTPWSDGVPGLSQYSIKPGDSYMYRWTADEQGAYFYHSHYKGQIMDGLYGAIFITPADGEEQPFSSIDSAHVDQLQKADDKNEPLFISDWSKYTFDEFFAYEQAGNVDIACADALIVNGMGGQYCLPAASIKALSAPQINNLTQGAGYTAKGCLPANTVATQGNFTRNLAAVPADVFDTCTPTTGKNYTLVVDAADGYAAMTFINPGAFAMLKANIVGHKMWTYNYNGRYIVPQQVDQITVGNGERVSVFVKLDQAAGDYDIQISNLGLNQLISGFAKLSYKGSKGPAGTTLLNYAGNGITNTTTVVPFAALKAAPFPGEQVAQKADKTWKFNIQKLPNQPDAYRWSLAGNTAYDMSRDEGHPLLYQNPADVAESDIIKKTNMGEWVDIIMTTTGPLAQPHPIHKHANKFFVIGQAKGNFTWNTVEEAFAANSSNFNLVNPPFLDGFITLAGEGGPTWTVFRYKVEIAGAWLLHCHMQTHLSGGMAVAIMDGVDAWPTIPSDAGKTCQGNGASNSTWEPSCACPASCPANSGASSSGSSNLATGSTSSGTSSSDSSTGSGSGSWVNGVWVGNNNPSTGSSTNSYSPAPSTGSYSSGGNTTEPIKTYTGAASASHVSLFTVLALAVAALSL